MGTQEIIRVRAGDLEVSKVFDGDELIIEVDRETMATIRCEEGIESEREYNIRIFHYDLHIGEGDVEVKINGYGEIFNDESTYEKDKQMLIDAGVWNNEGS